MVRLPPPEYRVVRYFVGDECTTAFRIEERLPTWWGGWRWVIVSRSHSNRSTLTGALQRLSLDAAAVLQFIEGVPDEPE